MNLTNSTVMAINYANTITGRTTNRNSLKQVVNLVVGGEVPAPEMLLVLSNVYQKTVTMTLNLSRLFSCFCFFAMKTVFYFIKPRHLFFSCKIVVLFLLLPLFLLIVNLVNL